MTVAIAVALVVATFGAVAAFVVYGGRELVALTNPDDPARVTGAHILRYHFGVGQDPAAVIDSVRQAGYHATTEYNMGQVDLLVVCSGDPVAEREKVRAAIAGAPDRQGIHGDTLDVASVRFVDEPPGTALG